MPKFRVELTAKVKLRYFMEIEAEDEMAAKQAAVETAPKRSSFWEIDSNQVTGIDAVDAEEEE